MRLDRALLLHLAVIALLFAMQYILPPYHQGNLARIMVLATFATGYNILFGYTGLLSLGHALYFAAGMYGAGMTMRFLDFPAIAAFPTGIVAATALAAIIGALALRTTGVAFMIVTLMFAQAGYLTLLLFNEYTRGDEGFVIPQADRTMLGFDLSSDDTRFIAAWLIFSIGLLIALAIVRSKAGRVMVAIRENEERTRMLGFNPFPYKLGAVVASGAFAGAAGAGYALLFGSVGASFASIQYSIEPLLFVLLGGAGVVLGPLVGSILIFYLIDYARELTTAYLIVVGIALVLLVLFARKGVLGSLRRRTDGWLP